MKTPKRISKHKFYTFESILAGIFVFLEVDIFIRVTPLTTQLPIIDELLASSTLNIIINSLGPLLGVIGALVTYFYKSLEDRKMSWEKELIECIEEPYRKKTIIRELTERVNGLTAESKEIRFNLIFVFLMFVLTFVVCLINQNFLSEDLASSAIRLIVPIGFSTLSILSILPLVFSFHGGLSSILIFPTSVNPMLTIKDAQNLLNDDPFGAILICFFTVEKATDQFLSSFFRIPKIRSHIYTGRKLTEISSELGRRFGFLSEIRHKTVFGLLEPSVKLASNYIDLTKSYLKLLDGFSQTNGDRKGGFEKSDQQ